jgi:hypothetical protein
VRSTELAKLGPEFWFIPRQRLFISFKYLLQREAFLLPSTGRRSVAIGRKKSHHCNAQLMPLGGSALADHSESPQNAGYAFFGEKASLR